MYKVLIAEDEILVRLGLANSISWGKLGLILTAQASNGAQAWELFQKEHPDIVITDIRMPLMDGMELIRKIREIDSKCKIIILTCVDEFEYARSAIAYQVEDYILKLSMDIGEIETLLSSICKALDSSHAAKQDASSSLPQEIPIKQELYDCLLGYTPSFSYNSLTAPFFSKTFQIAFIQVLLEKKVVQKETMWDSICTDKSLYQLLQRQLEHDNALLIEKIPGNYFLLFHNYAAFSQDYKDLIPLVKNYFNSRPVCGVSASIQTPGETSKAAQCAQVALSQYFFHPDQYLFNQNSPDDSQAVKDAVFSRTAEIILSFSASYPGVTSFWAEYEERIRQFLSERAITSNNIRKLFYYLADWLQETLFLSNSQAADNCVYNYRRYIFESAHIEDIYYIFERLLNKLLTFTASTGVLSREMLEITRYIEAHYAENLSLEELAAHVNYSKGYLCNIFRKELNTSFGNYLTKVRISHAKKLLTDSFLRLYEIAEQTGFYDYSHFARTFKKATGFSPQEYQNHQTIDMKEGTLE